MAYRLERNETAAQGMRRLARRALKSARTALGAADPPADKSVHEARKSIKKVRAIIELVDADDGKGLRGARKRLRKVSRALSRLRDADAMLETLSALEKGGMRLDEHTLAQLRRRLRAHRETVAKEAADSGVWAHADRALRRERKAAKDWRPAHRKFRALGEGIEASFTEGRRALERARAHGHADDFHRWRKRLKTLRYQLRLVDGCSAAIRKDVQRLHAAERSLGEDHNVAVLCAALTGGGSRAELEPLRQAAARRQKALRARAVDGVASFYALDPRDYVRRIERAWKKWTSRPVRRRRRRAA